MAYRRFTAIVLCITLIAGLLSGCGTSDLSYVNVSSSSLQNGSRPYAVSSSSLEAEEVGLEVLRKGGNAVDAAVAVALTLSVVEPYASGLGGGGYMLIYDAAGNAVWSVDYFASAGSAEEMTDSIAIPGLLKGLQTALDRWGTMSLSDLIQPAIDYAENGFSASDTFVKRLRSVKEVKNNSIFSDCQTGDTVYQPELAQTLRTIRDKGIDAFYQGKIAEDIAAVSGLTPEDLRNYPVYVEPAIQTEAFGYTLYGTYAPSSAITVMQMLKMAEMLDIPSPKEDSAGYMNTLKTITLAAFQSRSTALVDPRVYDWDSDAFLNDDYLRDLIRSVSPEIEEDPEKMCTTQFSVIDSNGMTVCVTNSLSDNWGSGTQVDGFYLNNTLSLFGETTRSAYSPGRRPRTHFSPLIITGSNGEIMAIGSPGGKNIPRIIASVLLDILKFGTDIQTAVDKARVLVDDTGYACVEASDTADCIVDVDRIPFGYYYSDSHLYFGCTSIVGNSPETGIYSVNDGRRVSSDTGSAIAHLFGW